MKASAEVWSLLLAHAWERICSYPLARRPERVAANLLYDTLRDTLAVLADEWRLRTELTGTQVMELRVRGEDE